MRTPVLLLLSLVALAATALAAPDVESEAKEIENLLMSPCCMTNTVAVHESGTSQQMRQEIRDMLAAGKSRKEILDFYVARHGDQVLSMPEARGFSLTPYLFPLLFLVVGSLFLLVVFRSWRRKPAVEPAAATGDAPAGPWADRLRKELDQLD